MPLQTWLLPVLGKRGKWRVGQDRREREVNSQPGLEERGLEDHAVLLYVYRSFRGFPLKVIISADWKIVLKDLLLWYDFLHILLVAIQLQRIHQFLACLLLLPEPPIKKRPY